MSFYAKPSKLTQMLNSLLSRLASLGLAPADTVTVEVVGRRSGEIRSNVVVWVEHDGTRYLVAPRGETQWVRNVRAAGGNAAIRRRGRQPVRLEELPVERRAPVLQAYLKKTARATKEHIGLEPEADIAEFEDIAARYPIFRIVNQPE